MVMIAASLSVAVYVGSPVTAAQSLAIGFGLLTIMVLAQAQAARRRERAALGERLAAVEAATGRLGADLAHLDERFGILEGALERRIDDRLEPRLAVIDAEIGELVAQVRDFESRLDETGPSAPAAPRNGTLPASEPAADDRLAFETVRRAIADNRIEVFLQPVMQLPQRRPRYYEALTRLRGEDGECLLPATYMPIAEAAGLMPLVDNILLFRCVQIVRRMAGRAPDLAIFCNLSARSLADSGFFGQFIEFAENNRELARSLILEFPQEVLDGLGPVEQAGLDALGALGFHFSVDHVRNLDIDGPAYAARRVKFLKIDTRTLLEPPPGAPIHVGDLARLMARSGIELVAGRIETEAELVDLLDYEIRLGQGHLFSPPRPVRSEILAGASDGVQWSRAS